VARMLLAAVGPARCCEPRHRLPFELRIKGSICLG
jgi:hypothetical protein